MKDVFAKHVFNDILNNARMTGVAGSWSGSAFRDHPCGIVRGNLKLTNEWHVSEGCSIQMTDGDGWNTADICRESCAYGNPHPKPINGRNISVWSDGKWQSEQFQEKLEPVVRQILVSAMHHSISVDTFNMMISAQERYVKRMAQKSAISKALGKIQ